MYKKQQLSHFMTVYCLLNKLMSFFSLNDLEDTLEATEIILICILSHRHRQGYRWRELQFFVAVVCMLNVTQLSG